MCVQACLCAWVPGCKCVPGGVSQCLTAETCGHLFVLGSHNRGFLKVMQGQGMSGAQLLLGYLLRVRTG